MSYSRFLVCLLSVLLIGAGAAQGGIIGFVSNPTGNSTAWSSQVASQGGSVNTSIDFEGHPLDALQSNFYSFLGVTLTGSGSAGDVRFGAGPGQGNTSSPPLSGGEGAHAASRYLYLSGAGGLTISFNTPVMGAGLFAIDYFNPGGSNPLTISAYTGPNGTGSLLGSFNSVAYNFQPNNLYFMGLVSDSSNIGSLVFTTAGQYGDTIGLDDIRFATGGDGGGGGEIPEPSTYVLLGGGLIGLAMAARRRRQA